MHARTLVNCVSAAFLVGCVGGGDGDLPDPVTTGTITANDVDRSAVVETYKAFGFATNGDMLIFMAPNPNVTCATATEYLSEGGQFDPVDVLQAGHCSIIMDLQYTDSFDGVVHTGDDLGPIVNVNCAMGEGTWEVTGEGQQRGYRFTDEDGWWQGSATDFTVTTTIGADENTPDVSFDLGPAFGGQFIYDDTEPDPATGSATGDVVVERCQTLTQTDPWG